MTKEQNTRIEFDSQTIKAVATLCELSGLEIPEVINSEFLGKSSNRIKDLIIQLKKQIETLKEQTSGDNEKLDEYKNKLADLKSQIEELKKKGKEAPTTEEKTKPATKNKKTADQNAEDESDETNRPPRKANIRNILIIANIGLIMHQLKILFTKFGVQVTSVKNYTEAIGELKENEYDCILFDMQATSDNDLMLVEAIRKATEICNSDTTIVALTIPLKDKKKFKLIKSKGADIIIEKHESWHMNILKELKIAS